MPTINHAKQVEIRLRIWGDWRIEFFQSENGFPRQSSFLNPAPSKDSGFYSKSPIKDSPLALEVDAIMIKLSQRHQDWFDVLNAEYTEKKPRADKYKKLNLSRPKYHFFLDLGKAWVESRIA